MTKPVVKVSRPRLKFIDKLEQELTNAGMKGKRDGWQDYSFDKHGKRSERADDHCEWIDIILEEVEGKRYIVQFYFSKNSTKLYHVQVYIQKRKKGWKPEKLIATSKVKQETVKPPQEIKSDNLISTLNRYA